MLGESTQRVNYRQCIRLLDDNVVPGLKKLAENYTNKFRKARLERSFERIKNVIVQLNSRETATINRMRAELP